MINTGIKGVIDNKKRKKDILTIKDIENIIIYIYGISDFFNKMALFTERTDAYIKISIRFLYKWRRIRTKNKRRSMNKKGICMDVL